MKYENQHVKRDERLERLRKRGVSLPWDVFPTTHEEMEKQSIHGTDPRDNPEGGEAKHHGGA